MSKLGSPPNVIFDDKNYFKAGLISLVIFVGIIGSWMLFSKLDSAAIAPGIVSVEGQRKAVEHFEGGIVEEVLVQDGDTVEINQPLIKLSAVTARTRFSQLNLKYYGLLAQLQRLQHERIEATNLQFSDEVLNAVSAYPALASVLETQRYLFKAKLNLRRSQLSSLDSKLSGIKSDKKVLVDKIEQEVLALSFLDKEVSMNDTLLKGGYSSQSKTYELKRTQAQFSSTIIDLKGSLQNRVLAEQQTKQEIITVEYQYINDIEQELQEVTKVKDDTFELLVQAGDVLSRVVVKSPHAGQVVGLAVFNSGDVISPGETLLQVVPLDERLIIVATLKPEDIDDVKVGQKAMVRLTAYSFRTTPPIIGKVIHVAADRLVDRNPAEDSGGFTIKVSIDKEELDKLSEVKLHPGMPAEVYINLKSRTPLDYLLEPLSLDLFRAFREI